MSAADQTSSDGAGTGGEPGPDVLVDAPGPGVAGEEPSGERDRRDARATGLRKRTRRAVNVSVVSLIVAVLGLGIAFQPDQFQRVVAAYYGTSVEVEEPHTSDAFVAKIVSVGDRNWFVKRIWGTRIQFDEVDIHNGRNVRRISEAASEDKAGVIEVPTSRCPDGNGAFLRVFVHKASSGQFGALDARQGRYVLDGLFDVGHVRSRYSEKDRAQYCYVDLVAVS